MRKKSTRAKHPRVCLFCKKKLGKVHGHHHDPEHDLSYALCVCEKCPTPEEHEKFQFRLRSVAVQVLRQLVEEGLEEEAEEPN